MPCRRRSAMTWWFLRVGSNVLPFSGRGRDIICPSTFQFPGPCACEAVLLFVHHAIIPCDADDEVKVDDIDIDKRCDSINYNLSASIIALLQQTGVGIDYYLLQCIVRVS
eukprot:scaffold104889_cov43-Attheya_sp.AAC.1